MNNFSENFCIIGHRGAAGERFENSLDGIRHAISLGVDAIEIDIRQHGSDLWVIHDHDMERLCGTSGLFEDQPDVSALRLLNGEPIPALQQVLELTRAKVALNIEIKSVQNLDLLLDMLAQNGFADTTGRFPSILISSFNHRAIVELKKSGCPWPLAPISSGVPVFTQPLIDAIQPYSWHFDNEYLDFELVNSLRQQQILSLVYTVNDPVRASRLDAGGVAGIFTDIPTQMI